MPTRWIIPAIAAAVLVWGVFHAVGAYRLNGNPWRPVMVLVCVAAYLGFWGLMLASRRARLRREADVPSDRDEISEEP
jgi:hypothetical protein